MTSEVSLVLLLLPITPDMVFAPVLLPVSVSVLEPLPEVKLLVKETVPDPDASSVAPPVVPAILITRLVVLLEEPIYLSVALVPEVPIAIVPLAVVVGAPRELAVLLLANNCTARVPALIVVLPV